MKLLKNLTLSIYLLIINLFFLFLYIFISVDFIKFWFYHKLNLVPHTFDYIVVGSGSAGGILAKRLAEQNVTVLVLEAGSTSPPFIDIPSLGTLLQTSPYDWQYRTAPQEEACWGLTNNVSFWPMGRIFGGTSRINNMVYIRGHSQDYSDWGFDYQYDILPYFKKLENIIKISDIPFRSTLADNVLRAAQLLNFNVTTETLNCFEGFSLPQATIFQGKRWISANLLNKENIKVHTNAIVEKILLKSNFEAYGVKYWFWDQSYIAKAKIGIILSAGVIGTPKILLQSGIGPASDLKLLGINPKIDLHDVGLNLQDHIATGMDLILLNTTLGLGIEEMLSPLSALQYFLNGNGPWTTIGCENVAFTFLNDKKQPQIQFMVLPLGISVDSGAHLKNLGGFSTKSWDNYFSKINKTSITILPIVLHPKSRGYVKLKDKNYKTPPIIDPKYLTNYYDIDIMIKGIKLIKELINTPILKGIGATLNPIPYPGCEHFKFDTNSYWECYIRHLTLTVYHPVGTCKLGVVTDFEFRVKNTNKLYIVDGSVLPTPTSGNIVAPIMMMAEKASDTIKYHNYLNNYHCNAIELFVPIVVCYKI